MFKEFARALTLTHKLLVYLAVYLCYLQVHPCHKLKDSLLFHSLENCYLIISLIVNYELKYKFTYTYTYKYVHLYFLSFLGFSYDGLLCLLYTSLYSYVSFTYILRIQVKPVSYTHLDVYKRQVLFWLLAQPSLRPEVLDSTYKKPSLFLIKCNKFRQMW